MAVTELKKVIDIIPQLLDIPYKNMWYTYDEKADVLYLNFKKPSHADDSVLTDDDIVIRYEEGKGGIAAEILSSVVDEKLHILQHCIMQPPHQQTSCSPVHVQ